MPVGVVVGLAVFGVMVVITIIVAAVSAVSSVTGLNLTRDED